MSDWRDIVREDLRRQQAEDDQPWWRGWFYPGEIPLFIVIVGFAVLFACILWGGGHG